MTPALPTRPRHRLIPAHDLCPAHPQRQARQIPTPASGQRNRSHRHSFLATLSEISLSLSVHPLPRQLAIPLCSRHSSTSILQHKQRSVHQSISQSTLPGTATNTPPQHLAHQHIYSTPAHLSTSTSYITSPQHISTARPFGNTHLTTGARPPSHHKTFDGLNLHGQRGELRV